MSIKEREGIHLPLLDDAGFVELVPVSREILMQTISLRAAWMLPSLASVEAKPRDPDA